MHQRPGNSGSTRTETKDQPRCPLVILPAHNEAPTIRTVIEDIRSHVHWSILVVDDASSDRTAQIAAASGAKVITLPVRLGAWGTVQTGIRYARGSGHDSVVTMDADGQHYAESLLAVFTPVNEGHADVSIGACPTRVSGLRRLIWHLFRKLTGLQIEDLTSGLRAYNAASLAALESPEATLLEYQDIGVLLLLRTAGLRIAEVAVEMRPRESGRSRVFPSAASVAYYLIYTFLLCLGKRGRP